MKGKSEMEDICNTYIKNGQETWVGALQSRLSKCPINTQKLFNLSSREVQINGSNVKRLTILNLGKDGELSYTTGGNEN